MARPLYTDALRAASCPTWADLRARLHPLTSVRAEDRVDVTHALYCPRCGPIVDRIRRTFAADIAAALAEAEQDTPPADRPVVDVPVAGDVL